MVAEKLKPDDTEENNKRKAMAELAGTEKLAQFSGTDFIEQYATHFPVKPDDVWQMEFDDVFIWIHKWKEKAEYTERYRAIEKVINETK